MQAADLLRARVITAVILAPLVIAAIYLLPLSWYALFFWLIAAAGVYEWVGLGGVSSVALRVACLAALAGLALVTWQMPLHWPAVLWLGCGFWALATVAVLLYPRGARLLVRPAIAVPTGLLMGLAAWLALVVIRDQPGGATWVLWFLFLVWSADIGAYFAGHRFGRHRLAPRISPGKTWEGLAGGALVSVGVATVMLWPMGAWQPVWIPLVVLLVAVSVFGDLFESVLKRQSGVKDSGALLPGHGGALDRIDSVVAALPPFAIILTTIS